MPNAHKHPAKAFRPPPTLYERAQKARAEAGGDMNSLLVAFLRWYVRDEDNLPDRPPK